jgi:hypothetical protein
MQAMHTTGRIYAYFKAEITQSTAIKNIWTDPKVQDKVCGKLNTNYKVIKGGHRIKSEKKATKDPTDDAHTSRIAHTARICAYMRSISKHNPIRKYTHIPESLHLIITWSHIYVYIGMWVAWDWSWPCYGTYMLTPAQKVVQRQGQGPCDCTEPVKQVLTYENKVCIIVLTMHPRKETLKNKATTATLNSIPDLYAANHALNQPSIA